MSCYNNSILLSLLLILLMHDSKVVTLSSSCQSESCGDVKIPYPFGIQDGCYLDEWYKIECRHATSPFLSKMGKEVVNISLPGSYSSSRSFGSIRVRHPITSVGCSRDGKDSGSVLNLTDSPFFLRSGNSLVAVGCDSKVSLTNIEPSLVAVGCELNCTASKETLRSKNIPFFNKTECSNDLLPYRTYSYSQQVDCSKNKERSCDGNGCCEAILPDDAEPQQVIGVRIDSSDHGNSTNGECIVAFLTDEVDAVSNETKPQSIFAQVYTTVTIGCVIQTNNLSFLNSLSCKNTREYDDLPSNIRYGTSCTCDNITISGTNYANCGCTFGYLGNPYLSNGCTDFDDCTPDSTGRRRPGGCREGETCKNMVGTYKCVPDKTVPILIGLGAGFGILVLTGGIWFLRKFLKKRMMNQRKRMFFKRNGGLLLQQQLNTREGNVETTRIFSSKELEKATVNFSENRILGQGGQGTVYKGMLVDG